MKLKDLNKNQTVKDWLLGANVTKNTQTAYLYSLQAYTEYTGKAPEALILEAEADIQQGILPRHRKIKAELLGFRQSLQDKGKAQHTVKTRMTALSSFYKSFDIEIPNLPNNGKAQTLIQNTAIPEKEDIREVLKVADPLETALILVGVSSGLAANEICNLRVKDFKKGFDPETEITTLKLRRIKVGFDFITFLTPEASRAVQNYLAYRNRELSNKRSSKQKVLSNDDFLFIVRQIPEEYWDTHDENLRKLDSDAIAKIYRRLAEQAQQTVPSGQWGFIRAHNLRKFFASTLRHAEAENFFIEFLMGHTVGNTRAAYFKPSAEKLKEIYKKYVDILTITKEEVEKTPEFKILKEEVKRLTDENEALKLNNPENEALKQLKKEVEELRKAQKEKEELESILSDIIAGEFSELNRQGADWDAKYAEHENRMKADPVYRKKYFEFEMPFILETFGNEQGKELEEYRKKGREERKRLRDTENKLYDALTGTKTLSENL